MTLFLLNTTGNASDPDTDPRCPRNPPQGECGEPAAEKSQSPPPRRKPHLVLTCTVTGSPGLNLRPHTFQFFIQQP